MNATDVKKIAEILHSIFCGQEHETRVEMFETSKLCTFYVEKSIDREWELSEHRDWMDQAQLFIQLSHPLNPIEILQDLVLVYQTAMKIKSVNPKLMEYIKIIFR